MTRMLDLRGYQADTLSAFESAWSGGMLRPATVQPTGSGKTVEFAHMCARAVERSQRPMVLVHRNELAEQTLIKLRTIAPSLRSGLIKADRRDTEADVIVGSVQTLARENRRQEVPPESVGLVVVDECHHAAAPSYVNILHHFGCFDSTPAAGFTATMSREDKRGLGDVWQDIVNPIEILWMIGNGYLCDVKGKTIEVPDLDLKSVKVSGGDFQDTDLGDALEDSSAASAVVKGWLEEADNRPTVLFAPTVASAYMFQNAFRDAGITAETITGAMDPEERKPVYARFRAGVTKILCNCMVLTEGWDEPMVSCAIIARMTKSAGLFVQMVGRILRTHPTKKDALVLDVAGAATKHTLASLRDLSPSKPVEIQPGESYVSAAQRMEDEEAEREHREARRITFVDVDLFARSSSAWLQTRRGKWFLATKDHIYFLWPNATYRETGLVDLGKCSQRTVKGGIWIQKGIEQTLAMSWAEQMANEEAGDYSVSKRTSAWRQRGQKPTTAQLNTAAMYGLTLKPGMSKGEVSDALSVFFTSRLLDR